MNRNDDGSTVLCESFQGPDDLKCARCVQARRGFVAEQDLFEIRIRLCSFSFASVIRRMLTDGFASICTPILVRLFSKHCLPGYCQYKSILVFVFTSGLST